AGAATSSTPEPEAADMPGLPQPPPAEPIGEPDHVEALRRLARDDPDRVAAQLQAWLRGERTGG
ncbi:MAG: hypothetical protein ACE5O2_13505, partial [Armatimonadota bacterium]